MDEQYAADSSLSHQGVEPAVLGDRLALVVACALFFFSVFFPYVQIIPLESDTQPYALVLAAVVALAARRWLMPLELVPLLIVFLASIGVAALGQPGMQAVRSIANYASLLLIAYAAFLALGTHGRLLSVVLRGVVHVWFVVGLIQTVIYPDFLVFLTPRALGTAGSGGRGVVGLSPEPTHYGLFCLLLLVLIHLARGRLLTDREVRWQSMLLAVQIVVFARSSMAVLLLALYIGWYAAVSMFSPKRALYLLASVAVLGGGFAALVRSGAARLEGTRMYALLGRLLEDPTLVLLVDASVNDRVFHIVFSVLGWVENFLLPNGYTAWEEYVTQTMPRFAPYAWSVSFTRILSGYGAALFELGFFGLLVPLVLNVALFRSYRADLRSFLIISFALNTMLWTNVPLATPMVGFILGFVIHYSRRQSDAGLLRAAPASSLVVRG